MPLYDQNRQFLGYGAPTAAPVTPMGMQHGQYYGQHYPQQYPQYPQWQGQFGTAYNYAVAQQTGYYPNAYGQPQQYEVQPQKPMVTAHVVEELEEDEVQQNIDRILRESSQSRDPTPHLRQNSQPRKDSNAGLTIVVPDAAVFPGSTTSSTPASEVGTPLGEQGKRDWSYEGNKNHFIPMKECTQYDDLLAFDPEWEESVFEKFVYPKAVQIMSPVALDVSQFPILYAPGTEELQSKYTVGENKAIFNLPIKETKFWESMKHDPAVDEIDYDCQLVKYEDWDEYQQARQAWYISTEIERGVVRNVRPPSRSSKSDHVDKRDDDFRIGTYRRSYHGKKNRGWKGSGSRRQSNASVNSIDISRSRRSSFAAVADPEIRLPVPSRTHTPIPASIAPPVAWKSYDHASVWQHASRDPKDGSCIGEESKNTGDHLESGENKG